MAALVAGLFGLIIGSFLNVVILRHGERSLTGRSACMACGKTLGWYELFPVFSFIALRGKCGGCGARISLQYPLVEAATGVLFALTVGALAQTRPLLSTDFLIAAPYLAVAALYICITVYDLYYKLIPNEWAYLAAGMALLASLVWREPGANIMLILLSGPIAALPLYALWAVSKGRWMGLGDPKLALSIGWLLGPLPGIVAVFLAFIIGALVSVLVLIPLSALRNKGNRLTMKSEVPFGPFLVTGTLIIWLAALYGFDAALFLI